MREYWRFDYTGGRYHDAALAGDLLANEDYEPIHVDTGDGGIIRGYSAALGLELHWSGRQLRFYNPITQEYLPDLIEALAALAEAEVRTAEAEARAAAEQTARRAAEQRIRQLEAQLRRRQL